MRLGNRLEQWTFDEFYDRYVSDAPSLPKLIGVRSRMRVGNKKTSLYPPHRAMLLATQNHPESRGWLFDEALLPPLLVLQGEVMPDERHLYLRWTHCKAHMRTAFSMDLQERKPIVNYVDPDRVYQPQDAVFHHANGLFAWSLLKEHMDAPSWDCLQEILHNYDNPVVEFSIANRPVGIFKWNTIFWEVRTHY